MSKKSWSEKAKMKFKFPFKDMVRNPVPDNIIGIPNGAKTLVLQFDNGGTIHLPLNGYPQSVRVSFICINVQTQHQSK